MSTQGSGTTTPTAGGGAWIYTALPLLVALVLLLGYAKGCVVEHKTKAAAKEAAAATYAATHPPTPAPQPVIKVGKERRLYRFADYPNGCAVMQIESDASFYPKGGKVTIHPPKGESWEDAPGILTKKEGTTQPPGWYMVCKKDSDAWGIEIWN